MVPDDLSIELHVAIDDVQNKQKNGNTIIWGSHGDYENYCLLECDTKAVWWVFTAILEEHVAFIFRAEALR